MSPEMLSLIAGLVGAVVGAGASILTVVVQSRIQDRRERVRQSVDLALEDYKIQLELANKFGHKGGKIPPVTLFVDYHLRLVKHLEAGDLTPEAFAKVIADNRKLLEKMEELNPRTPECAS